jgi:alpha-1,6-mannosyltransferase
MPLKTLHLTNAYHPDSGGIRTMYRALLHQANREHRLMRLIVPAAEDHEERVGRFGLIYHLRAPRAPFADRRYRMLLPHRFIWTGVGRIWEILKREMPDVLEVCDKYSLCYLAGIMRRYHRVHRPTLVGLSCERLDDNLAAYLRMDRLSTTRARAYLGRVYIGMFDAHIANSEYTAEELRASIVPGHSRPVHVCPMGVDLPPDLTSAEQSAARRKLVAACGGADHPIVIYAGRLSPEKHVDLLPEFMSSLLSRGSPARMVIAGDGPLRRELQSRLDVVAPGRAHFLGHVGDRHLLRRLIAGSDVFLHPNPKEPFGIAPLEAMACGTPLVAPHSGGVLSYATDDNAWLTQAEPDAFADAVESVLRDPLERSRRSANGRLTARQFTWPVAAARLFQTYERVHAARMSRSTSGDAPRVSDLRPAVGKPAQPVNARVSLASSVLDCPRHGH